MNEKIIRSIDKEDKAWIKNLLKEWWAGPRIVTRGKLHLADELPGFITVQDDEPPGLITYDISGDQCEIVTMNSLKEGQGIGPALIDTVRNTAIKTGCRRLWLITTNDNTAALRFWQKRGFKLVAEYPDSIEQSRRLNPEIPLTGNDGIPIRDEIELERIL